MNAFDKLPEACHDLLLENNTLITIKRGESGYYPTGHETTSDEVDALNEEIGITKAQRAAMEWGSQFSWSSMLANPDNYDENGKPYCEKNPRPIKA